MSSGVPPISAYPAYPSSFNTETGSFDTEFDFESPAYRGSRALSATGPSPETTALFDRLHANRESTLAFWNDVKSDGTTLGAVGGTLGRVFAKAGYGLGEGVAQAYGLVTDPGYGNLVGLGLSHLLADRGTTPEMLGALGTYWNAHSAGEIVEDAAALAVGGLVSMGIGAAAYGTVNAAMRAATMPDLGGPFTGDALLSRPALAVPAQGEIDIARNWDAMLGEPDGPASSPRLVAFTEPDAKSSGHADAPQREAVRAQIIETIDPDRVSADAYAREARDLGMTAQQTDALKPWTMAARDSVTGFFDGRQSGTKTYTVRRAQQWAGNGAEAFYVSADIGNLGGLNAAMHNVAEAANVHYRALAQHLAEALRETDAAVVPLRTGGDELGIVVAGLVDRDAVAAAIARAEERVAGYAREHGLDAIPHPKHPGQKGVSLHIGFTSVTRDKSLSEIFSEADAGVDRSKQHVTTGEGSTAWARRTDPPATGGTTAAAEGASGSGAQASAAHAGAPARLAQGTASAEVETPAPFAHPTSFAELRADHLHLDPDAASLGGFTRQAQQADLKSDQIYALSHYSVLPKDSVTAFYDARISGVRAELVTRAQVHVDHSDDRAFYVSADIANLSGLNHAVGNNAELANAHFRALASLFRQPLTSPAVTVIPLRTGGDELGALVVGNTNAMRLSQAMTSVEGHVAAYVKAQGLADIPHPKHPGETGVGLHIGVAEVLPGRTLDGIFTEADLGVDASKNRGAARD